ncbi:CDP-alcohol phosphatidyltransferase family protein [Aliivibrio kagoshimensis]|uniref:CDP-alcohol phosphatidyltransferase family protein n=1 Tax=Aliivibrio kagoshimensis TaxID=2910230 RepID=UPI003D14B285
MLDRFSVKVIKAPLHHIAKVFNAAGIKADSVTLFGFVIGLLAFPAIVQQQYELALILVLANRIFDGIDGAVARIQGITDSGGFLDITLDFLFYSLIPFAFVIANPDTNAIAGAFLIFSFIGTGSSFLAFAVMAGKRNIENPIYKNKSLYYIGGLTEGTETIGCFVFICLFPQYFAFTAYLFGVLCWVTTASRIWAGYHTLKSTH